MLNIYTVSFFGHRIVDNSFYIEKQLESLIRNLLSNKEYVDFLVGRNGEFDLLVSSTIERLKKVYGNDNCFHALVLPYNTAEYRDNYDSFNSYYDQVEILDKSVKSYFKSAFQVRNREMVDRSNLIVFYLEHEYGGAYQTYQYALKQNKNIIKLMIKND